MPRSPLFIARGAVMALAVVALLMVAAAGPGAKGGAWSWESGLALVKYGTYAALAAAIGASILMITLVIREFRVRPWVPFVAMAIALVAAAPGLIMLSKAKDYPMIHDVTTDPDDPPAFV